VDRHLQGQALFPGFVSAHSHAFQRGLRGQGERFPEAPGASGPGARRCTGWSNRWTPRGSAR
jgi:cytosine/adenosine deaminase-related metal-dependent hydrolase